MRFGFLLPVLAVAAAAPPAVAAPGERDSSAPPSQPHEPLVPVGAEVLLLHGTNNGTGIDPRIGKIPALSKPPFSAYNSYELVKREALTLAPNRATTTKLPNHGDLVVTFEGIAPPKKGAPKKYIVNVSIQKRGSIILPLLQVNANAGEMLFAAVPNFKGGVLVIGIKVVP